MPHTLFLPDSYSAHQISLLEDLLARVSPRDVEKAVVDLFAGCGGLQSGFNDAPGSWAGMIMRGHLRRPHLRNVPDDGFYSEMAFGAHLVSVLQIPEIEPVDANIIPTGAVPFSKLDRARPADVCVFHENDPMFADYLVYREARDAAWDKVELFASADCSLYTDMPFGLQIANTYLNRLTAHDLQRSGHLHAPLCRWGDERSYEPFITDVPLAFIGLPKHNAVWVGAYGVSKSKENAAHFRRGLIAMLEWLEPQRVFVYGAMKKSVFRDLTGLTDFVQYPDWTTRMHREADDGER